MFKLMTIANKKQLTKNTNKFYKNIILHNDIF